MPRSARRAAPPGRAGGRRGQQFRGLERARARPAIPASAPPADRAAARGLTTRTPRTLCVGRRVRLDLSRWPLSRAQRRLLASACSVWQCLPAQLQVGSAQAACRRAEEGLQPLGKIGRRSVGLMWVTQASPAYRGPPETCQSDPPVSVISIKEVFGLNCTDFAVKDYGQHLQITAHWPECSKRSTVRCLAASGPQVYKVASKQ